MRATTERVLAPSSRERWMLPRSQTEYPARPVLDEGTIHARREATFLVLAAMFVIGTCALVALGASHVIDVSSVLADAGIDVELSFALLLPLGAIAFAPTFIASALTAHLFGRGRATALIWVGLAACVAIAGILRLGDVVDGGDAFVIALASGGCFLVAHLLFLLAHELLRGQALFVRLNVASLIAQIAGWSTFGFVLHLCGGELMPAVPPMTIAGLCAGAAAFSFACVFLLGLPAALLARGLVIALRVGRDPIDMDETEHDDVPAFARRRPVALIVEEEDLQPPYSSGEMRFFREGDVHPD